jgi:hypothetical protein
VITSFEELLYRVGLLEAASSDTDEEKKEFYGVLKTKLGANLSDGAKKTFGALATKPLDGSKKIPSAPVSND